MRVTSGLHAGEPVSRWRGLRINGQWLFGHKHVTVQATTPPGDTLLTWTWPRVSAHAHFDWFLGRLSDLLAAEDILRDLSDWTTYDVHTQEPYTVHGWLAGVTLETPHTGHRSTLILTIRPFPPAHERTDP